MRTLSIATAFFLAWTAIANGQATQPAETQVSKAANSNEPTSDTQPADHGLTLNPWAFSASATTYIVPSGRSYVQPTITADYHALHLEARYNYENLDTTSLFAGWNFSAGDTLKLEATPLIGAVFGRTNGIAPGYKLTLSYKRFELYTEGEYLIDIEDSAGNFFYTWSEFTYSPLDWFKFGAVIQRTKAYKSDLDIQRGLLVGFSYRHLDFTTYVFNLGWEDPTVVFSVAAHF